MTMTDPIADMLTRIRNAVQVRHDAVEMPSSTIKVAIAKVLKDEGFIKIASRCLRTANSKSFELTFSTLGRRSLLTGIRRISKPGLRVYTKAATFRGSTVGWAWRWSRRRRAS